MEEKDCFEDYNLNILFDLEIPVLDDVLPPSVNLQGHSTVAGHARISPEDHPEAAQETHSLQEYQHENEQPAAADAMTMEELGLEELGIEETAEQELQENAVEPPPHHIPHHIPSYLPSQQNQEHQESVVTKPRSEFLLPEPLKDESQPDHITKISDEDLNKVFSEASLGGNFIHTDNYVEETFVVNSIGVQPLHQDLEDSNHHHVHGAQSDTTFHSLGNPGDDGDLSLLFGDNNDD